MKTSILAVTLVACALSAPIVSALNKSAPAKPAMSMEMHTQMSQMEGSMNEMQQQMEKIRGTSDPKEREKLLQGHMRTMQDSMKTMRGMWKPMTNAEGKHGAMMSDAKKNSMKPGDMMQHHEMMEKRIDMMMVIMEQMMQQTQAMGSMPVK